MGEILQITLKMLENLEVRPLMHISKFNYLSVKTYISGYFHAISDISSISINKDFSEWISNKQSSLFWSEYIYHILANNDEKKACELIFIKLREFIHIKIKDI